MTITDHKFGKGVVVYAAQDYDDPRGVIIDDIDDSFKLNGNPQGLLYALGFFLEYDEIYHFEKIVIRISQPRLNHFDEWTTTREHLLAFAEWVKVRSFAAWRLNAPRMASSKGCQWCKVQATCTAHAIMQEDIFSAAIADLTGEAMVEDMADLKERLNDPLGGYELKIAPVNSLSVEEMATLLRYRSTAENWWKKLEDTLYRAAASGTKVPGYKLVESRSRRVFTNKPAVVKKLVDELGIPKSEVVEEVLVSPAQAEVLLTKHGHRRKTIPTLLDGLVYKAPGNPTLVPLNDRRVELSNAADHAFDDLPLNPETPENEEI